MLLFTKIKTEQQQQYQADFRSMRTDDYCMHVFKCMHCYCYNLVLVSYTATIFFTHIDANFVRIPYP